MGETAAYKKRVEEQTAYIPGATNRSDCDQISDIPARAIFEPNWSIVTGRPPEQKSLTLGRWVHEELWRDKTIIGAGFGLGGYHA